MDCKDVITWLHEQSESRLQIEPFCGLHRNLTATTTPSPDGHTGEKNRSLSCFRGDPKTAEDRNKELDDEDIDDCVDDDEAFEVIWLGSFSFWCWLAWGIAKMWQMLQNGTSIAKKNEESKKNIMKIMESIMYIYIYMMRLTSSTITGAKKKCDQKLKFAHNNYIKYWSILPEFEFE